jgi:HAD superfamily hydrolase (TIGR01490 family)
MIMGTLVFLDIEGTLVDGSLSGGFVRAGQEMKLFARSRMLRAQGYMLLTRLLPRYAPTLRWQALLQLMAGHRQETIQQIGRSSLTDLRPMLKPAVIARLTSHKQQGDTVVLLSGGPHDAAVVVADAIGVDAGEGTQPEMQAGTYTGRMGATPINQGPAKARRAATLAAARGIPLAQCVAYGDSGADIPLLSAVGHPVAVDPDPALRAVASRRGWEILVTK